MKKKPFCIKKKIYYHDTDAGGVVYYGRYLEFLEDGRTEFFASRGLDTRKLGDEGTLFVVAHIEVDYKRPAVYSDTIRVSAEIEKMTASSVHFTQEISKGSVLLVEAKVVIVCVGENFKPKRLPPEIKDSLTSCSSKIGDERDTHLSVL